MEFSDESVYLEENKGAWNAPKKAVFYSLFEWNDDQFWLRNYKKLNSWNFKAIDSLGRDLGAYNLLENSFS